MIVRPYRGIGGYNRDKIPGDVSFAVQCHARGWTTLALDVLRQRTRHVRLAEVRRQALDYWVGRIVEPAVSWRVIVKQLRLVIRADRALADEGKCYIQALEAYMRLRGANAPKQK